MFPLYFLVNIVLGVLVRSARKEKEVKGVQIGKEGLKVALLADGVILFSGDPKDFTRKLLELVILSAKW